MGGKLIIYNLILHYNLIKIKAEMLIAYCVSACDNENNSVCSMEGFIEKVIF